MEGPFYCILFKGNHMFDVSTYFDGNVKSIAFQGDVLPATIGVMAIGEYEFGTQKKEYMEIISGSLSAKLPGTDVWQTFIGGESFEVDANVSFQVKVTKNTAYLCSYE